MRAKPAIVFGLLLAVAGAAQAAGDPVVGEKKAATCMGCHGVQGYRNAYPAYHVPKLGGQNEQYVVSALKAYKNGERSHRTMKAQAASLSEKDMQDIAAYFAQAGDDEKSE